MKFKWLLNNSHVVISTLGAAALAAGCCSKGTGGSYSYNAYQQSAVSGTAETQESASGTQTIPLYMEQPVVSTRQVDDGTVTIRKVVKTETVNEPVTLQKETLTIDRQPSSTGVEPGAQAFQDQQITIPLHHDEPVVSTQIVPNGQIVAQTRSETQQTTVSQQIRKEKVAIDKGNAQNVVISDNVMKDVEGQEVGGASAPGGQVSGTSAPITDVSTVTACSDPNSLNGRQVQLNNVKIDQVSDRYVYVTDNSGKDACIHLEQPVENLHPGDTVNITGTVADISAAGQPPEPMPQAASGQRICIQAQSVQEAK